MQVVRVEFVTHYSDVQEAVDIVSQMLPDLGIINAFPKGSKIESWNIYKVEERTPVVKYWVEDGKVVNND